MEEIEDFKAGRQGNSRIVKVPGINGLRKTEGCEKAPEKILDVLKNEIYSKESGKPIDFGSLKIKNMDINNSNLEKASGEIYDGSLEELKNSKEDEKIIFLGGDHSVSYNTARAFFDYCQSFDSGKIKEPCLIVFDAHPDLMSVTSGAEKYPNHEEWLRQLIKDGFPVENILLVGVRNSDKQEREFIKEKGIKTMPIDGFFEDIQGGGDMIMEFSQGKELYVSLDIDVVDPAFAPGTGYTEAGGFSSREFLYLVKRINKIKNLKALDIVEINPEKDEKYGYRTVKFGGRILGELV